MEELLEAIRAAVAPDATDEARARGATACRTILTALEAKSGEPLTQPSSAPTSGSTPSAIATAVAAFRNVPPEQLLDLAIARLRAALPTDAKTVAVEPVKFHVVSFPRVLPPKVTR